MNAGVISQSTLKVQVNQIIAKSQEAKHWIDRLKLKWCNRGVISPKVFCLPYLQSCYFLQMIESSLSNIWNFVKVKMSADQSYTEIIRILWDSRELLKVLVDYTCKTYNWVVRESYTNKRKLLENYLLIYLNQTPIVRWLDNAIHRINVIKTNHANHWIVIFPVDSVIQPWNYQAEIWNRNI